MKVLAIAVEDRILFNGNGAILHLNHEEFKAFTSLYHIITGQDFADYDLSRNQEIDISDALRAVNEFSKVNFRFNGLKEAVDDLEKTIWGKE